MIKRVLVYSQSNRLRDWWSTFAGVRSRILVWYFLLTAGITFLSVYATYKIFCDSTQRELGGQLEREVSAFRQQVEQPQNLNAKALTKSLEAFSAKQVPNPDRHLLVIFDGQVLAAQPVVFDQAMLQRWTQLSTNSSYSLEGYLIRVLQPLKVNGQQRGTIIAVHDATLRYRMAELTLRIVVQVTLIGLVLFSAIAWLTAGRVLSPLRHVTDTARSISETDLTQRLSVQGKDEIAELTLTFNQMLDRLQAGKIIP